MTRILPVVFRWTQVHVVDEDGVVLKRWVMDPLMRYDNVCKRQYHDGEEYPLVPLEARSRRSHNHYFAALHDAFENLPEALAPRWPTTEHMRKWLLIEVGYCEVREWSFDSQKDAMRLGRFFRQEGDPYSRVHIREENGVFKIQIRTAKSQSAAAMGKAEFDDSKKKVLEKLEEMIGLAKGELAANAGSAA